MSGPALPDEILSPDTFCVPSYGMSPFGAPAIARLAGYGDEPEAAIRLDAAFPGDHPHTILTRNGREAIAMALAAIGLSREDEVYIVGSSGGPYVSGCVTGEIEKVCRWSMRAGPRMRACFVIHDFGYANPALSAAAALGVPMIEDCAYAWGSGDATGPLGATGDFVVYSASKKFAVPYGGVLRSRRPISTASSLGPLARRILQGVLRDGLPGLDADAQARRAAYAAYEKPLGRHGFVPFYPLTARCVPGGYVVRLDDAERIGPKIKAAMARVGVQSSVYYGCGGYYLPCHGLLGPADIAYIAANFVSAAAAARMAA